MREKTCCHHIGYSFRLAARVLLYASSHRQDNTYHCLCYTSHGILDGTRNSSMVPPHEGLIRWPIASWANALTISLQEGRREGRGRKEGNVFFNLTSTIGEISTRNERVYEYEPCSSLYRNNSIGNKRIYAYEPCSSLYRII